MPQPTATAPHGQTAAWAKVIDHTRCIGCHACSTACKSENQVPLGVNRTYVKYVDVGRFPKARRAFQVTRCNQCEDPPCATACPTAAMHQRADGIVDFDKSLCIGCKACIAACPYDAIFINPEDHSAEKCNFCAHRLDIGLEPACVVVCPTQAILVGDENDPDSAVGDIVGRQPVAVRRPEKETRPKLYYVGAHQATLDPLAAARPDGGLFMWSEQGDVPHGVPAGNPGHASSSAAALLSYDVPHRAPWDFRVSLYTWTKSIAAGAYVAPLLLLLLGLLDWSDSLWTLATPLVAMLFLGLTGVILIWDLEHPTRFYYLLVKPQWKSWLVRGGFIISGYGAVLAAHLAAGWLGRPELLKPLAIAGLPLAVMAAVYTAYLFAQAKARDLWQSPLLPSHLATQSVLAGSGVMLLVATAAAPGAVAPLAWMFAGAGAVHLLMTLGEIMLTHGTAHAHLATLEMTRGKFSRFFWSSILLALLGLAAPWMAVPAAVAGLVGLLAFEHAYVQAGQSVPLA